MNHEYSYPKVQQVANRAHEFHVSQVAPAEYVQPAQETQATPQQYEQSAAFAGFSATRQVAVVS